MSDQQRVELVRQLMAELLDIPDLGADDNLFNRGGDSFTGIRLAWRLSEAIGVEVNAADDIMADPTPRSIAGRLAGRAAERA